MKLFKEELKKVEAFAFDVDGVFSRHEMNITPEGSGTEPKIKTYFTTLGKDLAEAQAQKDALAAAIEPILK